MKLAAVLLLAMASPAMADGPYIGGFVSKGAYGEMGWTGPNSSRKSTVLGGFAGYGFQTGGFIVSPEVRLYGGADHQTRLDYLDTVSWPGLSVIDRFLFKETLGASVGANLGAPIGRFTPYVGGSLGMSRLKFKTTFTPPGFVLVGTLKENTLTRSIRAGVEYNFDRFFARAEIEKRWFRHDWLSYRKTEASFGVGVRF